MKFCVVICLLLVVLQAAAGAEFGAETFSTYRSRAILQTGKKKMHRRIGK
jgi:hypothetical protein